MKKPLVAIAQNSDIAAAVKEVLDHLTLPNLTGKRILLKPNVGREADPKSAINTNPEVTKAVFEYLLNHYQAHFFLGDSPIIATQTEKAFRRSGYNDLLKDSRISFLDLDSIPPISLPLLQGKLLKEIKVTGYFNQIDYIVSIPVIKMHMHTGMSLSFKNCKGLIYNQEKIKLHHLSAPDSLIKQSGGVKELDLAIADLSFGIHPHLSVIDGSYVQEGMGPSDGTAIKRDLIVASTNFIAADFIAMKLVQPQWTIDKIPHLKLISQYHNGPKSLNQIQTIPPDIRSYQKAVLEPPTSITMKYDNVKLIDVNSCSACLSTIFLFIKYNKAFIDAHFTPEEPLTLVIGRGIHKITLYEPIFLVGNCAVNRGEKGILINGCAPVQ